MRLKRLVILALLLTLTLMGCNQTSEGPVISGLDDFEYIIGDDYPNYLYNVTVDDAQEGAMNKQIIVDDTDVDYTTPGTYTITFTITDSDQHTTTESRTVVVFEKRLDSSFDIYYVNDFHGAVLPDGNEMGLANIANLIMTKKAKNPNSTLFITGGDMLQGALLSNYYHGASVIDMLNLMGLDAFVIGNHEFDWGLDVLLQYFDQDSDAPVHANFPLLGANVIEKATGERPAGIDAYTVIRKQGYKIGVIGTIGYGLESDIATSRVEDYEFQDPVDWVEYYSTYLRTIENVDIVLAVNHGDSDYFNYSVAALSDDARVDIIFNGHSHQQYVNTINQNEFNTILLQAGANGKTVGHTTISIDQGTVASVSGRLLTQSNEHLLLASKDSVQWLIDDYSAEIQGLMNDSIITAGEYLSQMDLTLYLSKLMRLKTDSDIAFHNNGGTRASVNQGEPMTVALAYDIFPFDNTINTVKLTGESIKLLMNNPSLGYDTTISSFDDDTFYTVATNDYVFTSLDYADIFDTGIYSMHTDILLRDLFIQVLESLHAAGYDTFYLYLDIPEPLSLDTYILTRSMKQGYLMI